MKTRILLIDGSQDSLDQLQIALEPRKQQWEIFTATSAEAALAIVESSPPAIVVTGLAIDGSDGISLVREIESRRPDIQRFIAATEDEKAQIEESIGSNFSYLPKPCPPDRLITEIQRCLAIDTWLGNAKVKEIVARMGEFPSLPPVYLKVVNALNARDPSAADIGHAIAGDIAISAKVLQVVNSSYYGFDAKISDITEAVSIIGLDAVKHLVLAIQVFGKLGRNNDQKALVDQLWHHSMSVAVAAKRIMRYETGSEKASEEAYTAGLLHDIGKLVMITAVPDEFEKARELARERNIPLWQAETEAIGCTHAETGAYLLGRWGMPASLVEAVALHHEPVNSSGTYFSALSAVHVANALVWERHPGDAPHPDAKPDETFLSEIGRGASWPEWIEVASGKRSEKPATPPKTANAADATSGPANGRAAAIGAKPSANAARPTQAKPKGAAVLAILSLAACAALVTVLILRSTPPSKPAPKANTPFEPEPIASFAEERFDETAVAATEPDPVALPSPEPDANVAQSPQIAAEPVEPAAEETLVADAPPEPAPNPQPKIEPIADTFPEINLAGIFYNPTTPMASVNGRIRRVGDTVSGAKIVRIDAKSLVVDYQGESRTYKLK